MNFLDWLTAPGYHWLIFMIVFWAVCGSIAMIVHAARGRHDEDDDE